MYPPGKEKILVSLSLLDSLALLLEQCEMGEIMCVFDI